MFWKTMGIIWTVLLLVGVALLWQSQRLGAGSGATEAFEQEKPPRGTQETAFVVEVPAKYMSLAPDLVHMGPVRGQALMQPEIMKWPRSFRQKVLLEPRKYYSVRPVGPKESGILAIDARACESAAQAAQLARAVADALISQVQRRERGKIDQRITHVLEASRDLGRQIDTWEKEISNLRAGSRYIGKGDYLAFHEARLVSERLVDARLRFERARARLEVAQAAARGLKAAGMPATPPGPDARGAGAVEGALEELEKFIPDAESDAAAEIRPAPSSRPAAKTGPEAPVEVIAGAGTRSTLAARIAALKQVVSETTAEVFSLEERRRELRMICTDLTKKVSMIRSLERKCRTAEEGSAKLDQELLELRLKRQSLDFKPRLMGVMEVK